MYPSPQSRSRSSLFRETRPRRTWQISLAFGRHISRRPALLALVVAIFAGGIVGLAGASSAVGTTALVVIGVLVTFILLPDSPHRLWNVDAKALAETVPGSRLVYASQQVAEALALQAPGPVATVDVRHIWNSALDGLSRVVGNPAQLAVDLNYRVVVVADEEPPIVKTSLTAMRCFPNLQSDQLWFSFCSNVSQALDHEFAETDKGCLAREVIHLLPDESLDAWERRVSDYPVALRVDGLPASLDLEAPRIIRGDGWRVVRTVFKARSVTERFVPTELTAEFRTSPNQTTFSVKFTSYYVVGATQVTFEVTDPQAVVEWDEYISGASRHVVVEPSKSLTSVGVNIRAPQSTVLQPGAGAVFNWKPRAKRLLADPDPSLLDLLAVGDHLPSMAALPTGRRECLASEEPLEAVLGVEILDAYATLGVLAPRALRLRRGVLDRLREAQDRLPQGFAFVVLDAWRTIEEQVKLIDHYRGTRPIDGFVASVDATQMRPPHATGGAVDLTLSWQGVPLALGTDFDSFSADAALTAFEDYDGIVRRLRRLFARAMLESDFAPYPKEWWHWSYGDDVWAAAKSVPALYETIETG